MSSNSGEASRLEVQWAGASRTFSSERVVIGREADCDVAVTDTRASRHHATVSRDGTGWLIVDSSSNGTYVDGQPITRLPVTPAASVTLRLGGPEGQAIQLSVVGDGAGPVGPAAPMPPTSASRPVPPTPTGGTPASPASPLAGPPAGPPPSAPPAQGEDWWRQLPVPQMPSGEHHVDAWAPAQMPAGHLQHGQSILLPEQMAAGRSLTLGREHTNDVVIDDPLVSRRHARLDLATPTSPAVLHDLNSFNGTFVNGQRVQGSVRLDLGAEVNLGNQTFRWDGQQLLASATAHEFTLYADQISVVLPDGRALLQNATFQLPPSSLTAVIGPSGAGKSTMLGALTGLRPATHGRVIWQGHDLYEHYDQLRFQIGLVPQQDIQHPQLKVRQALRYAAQLRLPPDTTAREWDARVETVAGQLQLTERLENRIGTQLSGGQKKRVSIATELLTAPPLLFLDEPTSGLDPGLDLEVMKQLRVLADGGRVVMVVTHSVLALHVCDNVMVLAPGGRIAYFGPPDGILAHFGQETFPAVFDMLDEPDLWQRIQAPNQQSGTGPLPQLAAAVPARPRQSVVRQLTTLIKRNTAVVVSDRLLLGMLLVLPLVLGGLSRLVPGSNGLSINATRGCPKGTELADGECFFVPDGQTVDQVVALPDGHPARNALETIFQHAEASSRLTVLIVGACLMGLALTIRELVGERPIFRREYAVGLSPSIYFFSKVIVLGFAAFVQGLVLTLIAWAGLPGADGDLGTVRVALTAGSLTLTMAIVGLALSAVVTSAEQTMPALVGTIMTQIVLAGVLFEIAGRPILEQIAWLAPSRWGYAASASAMDLVKAQNEREADDWIALPDGFHYVMDMGMLGAIALFATCVGLFLVSRSATEK